MVGAIVWGAFSAFARWPVASAVCRLLVAALPVAVVLFWFSSGARAVRAAAMGSDEGVDVRPAPEAEAPSSAPPIVWIVFDELPLLSIVDADLEIDREVYPHLAALAEQSTWYRNATTVWSSTAESVVSMLTGKIAEPRTPPTRDRYPDNLLTWLAPSHEVHSLEMITSLAPRTAVDLAPRPARSVRLSGLLSDTSIVAAQMLAPPSLGTALPLGFRARRRARRPVCGFPAHSAAG